MGHFSSFLRVSGVAAAFALLASCGSEDGGPHLSTVQFAPAGESVSIPVGTSASVTVEILVTVLGPNAQPLSNTDFTLTSAGTIFEGFIGEGNAVQVSSGIFRTGQFGSKKFTIVSPPLAAVDGDATIMEVWSGTAYRPFNVTVTCLDFDTSAPPACP